MHSHKLAYLKALREVSPVNGPLRRPIELGNEAPRDYKEEACTQSVVGVFISSLYTRREGRHTRTKHSACFYPNFYPSSKVVIPFVKHSMPRSYLAFRGIPGTFALVL